MNELLVILDPTDPYVFHTDVTCAGLWSLLAHAEAAADGPVDSPESLVDQAAADGLLLRGAAAVDDTVTGLRCCRTCRPGAAARFERAGGGLARAA